MLLMKPTLPSPSMIPGSVLSISSSPGEDQAAFGGIEALKYKKKEPRPTKRRNTRGIDNQPAVRKTRNFPRTGLTM
jgi:hypothetical protein